MEGYVIPVFTNSYEITRTPSESVVYFQFDIIEPECKTKRQNYEIIDRLQSDNAALFNPRPVYDGRKSMYSKRDIPAQEFPVRMNPRKEASTHKVYIKRVSTINAEAVKLLTQRRQPHDSSDLHIKSLNLLQLIVRQAPNIRHGFPADARSFYVSDNSKSLELGLSAWRGYFQSVRPTLGRLLINVDISHALVYTPGPLITTMMNHLRLRDARELQNLSQPRFRQLSRFLKGVLISVRVAPNMRPVGRPRPISDLVIEAGMQEFDKENERWTVKRHFETKYSVPVRYPSIVGVKIGKTAIVPAEFCEVRPGQVFRRQIPPEVQKDFLKFATQKPHERFSDITSAVRGGLFNYSDSDYMKEAGIAVSTQPMEIKGKVVAPPLIKYGRDQDTVTLRPKTGAWNMKGRQLYKPSTLGTWMVVVYERMDTSEVRQFFKKLVDNFKKLGMQVLNEDPLIFFGNPSDPKKIIEEHGPRVNPQLVLCILPEHSVEVHQAIKHWGDCRWRISTQCVAGKLQRVNDQYCCNVALKINSRLGGVNSVIKNQGVSGFLQNAMIIGADVGHPGPGVTNRPSMTGLVASLDPEASYMTSYSSVQQPRLELIQDLEQMVAGALSDYRQWRGQHGLPDQPPGHLVFYRDGVSEGEFEKVAQEEIPKIKKAFAMKGVPEKMHPKILFIVVGKRHHVRFFAKSPDDQDHSGNCPAGLLVDDSITNPNWPDFYLQSHAGLLGTSRPAHYIVLANEASIRIPNIQTLTFHLCHQYASATRSVSIPAPVYYADRLCARLPFLCEAGAALSDTASESTANRTELDLEQWKLAVKFRNVHDQMKLRMPFI